MWGASASGALRKSLDSWFRPYLALALLFGAALVSAGPVGAQEAGPCSSGSVALFDYQGLLSTYYDANTGYSEGVQVAVTSDVLVTDIRVYRPYHPGAVGIYDDATGVLVASGQVAGNVYGDPGSANPAPPTLGWSSTPIGPVTLSAGRSYDVMFALDPGGRLSYLTSFPASSGPLNPVKGVYKANSGSLAMPDTNSAYWYGLDVCYRGASGTATAVPATSTATATATATATSTWTPTATDTAVPGATASPTVVSAATGTATPTVVAVSTATGVPTSTPVPLATQGSCVNPGNPPGNAGYDYVTAANTFQTCLAVQDSERLAVLSATAAVPPSQAVVMAATMQAVAAGHESSIDASEATVRQAALGNQALVFIGVIAALAVVALLWIPQVVRGR